MSDPNAGVMMRWVLSIGWLTGRPAELSWGQGWSGWTDTELAGSTPAPLQHLLSICPHHTRSRGEVTRVSRPTLLNLAGSVWATLPVIGHRRVISVTRCIAAFKSEVQCLLFFIYNTWHFHRPIWINLSHTLLFAIFNYRWVTNQRKSQNKVS